MKKLLGTAFALLACTAARADWIGDFAPGATAICGQYTTYNPSTGAAGTLAGTPALAVYKIGDGTNSATESTTGVTHSEDVDSRTGMNRVCIDTSADGTFYSAGAQFSVVITTGTVNSVSVVGSEVKSFSLNKTAALRPATAGRQLVVDASGLADANAVKVGPTGSGTAQTARDIGASVLLSSGTGTGQLSLSSGAVLLQATQAGVTIPTVTNLTNAPSSGDLTSTMKTSIGTAVAASAVASVTGNVGGNVTGSVGSVASGGISEASFATTAGSFKALGIVDQGTAQAYTSGTPSLTLRSAAAFGDNALTGMTAMICGSTQGYCQAASIASNVGSTDVATLSAALPVSASGTLTYYIFGTAPASGGGGGLDASGVRAALGMSSANLDTQLSAIDDFVDTEVAAIKTKTDFLPSATAGSSGGLFIAGTNAATTITSSLTTTFTGNLTGSVASVSGNVGGNVAGSTASVTGAVGSVTGNVGGNVTGSVGSVASGGITANSFAADAITAAKLASDVTTELQTGLATSSALTTLSNTIGTPSNLGGGATVAGNLSDIESQTDDIGVAGAGLTAADDAILTRLGTPAGASIAADIATVHDFVDTEVAAVKVVTDRIDTALEADGGVYRFTTNALENAPVGEGGGGTDWTTGEKEQIRYRLGIDGDSDAPSATPTLATAAALTTLSSAIGSPSNLGTGATVAANLADIESETDDIGTAGAGLTAIPWNSAWNTSVRSALGLASANLDTQIAALPIDSEIADAILGAFIEGSITLRQSIRLSNAALGGKATGLSTTNPKYRDLGDTKNRIDATTDQYGNRSAVTLDLN